MLDAGWQIWLGIIVVGALIVALDSTRPWRLLRERLAVRPLEPTADLARAAKARSLEENYPTLTDDSVGALLLAEAKALAKTTFDGIKSLEAKAIAQIGLVGAGIGLLSFAGESGDSVIHSTAWLGAALVFLFASILANAACLWPWRDRPPSPEVYNSLETCANPKLKAPIELELTEGFLGYNRGLQVISVKKARLQGLGTALLIVGVLMLLLNFYFRAPARQDSLVHLNCTPTGPSFSCLRALPQ